MRGYDINFVTEPMGSEEVVLQVNYTNYRLKFGDPPRRSTLAKSLEALADRVNDDDHRYGTGIRCGITTTGLKLWNRFNKEFSVRISSVNTHLQFEILETETYVKTAV